MYSKTVHDALQSFAKFAKIVQVHVQLVKISQMMLSSVF